MEKFTSYIEKFSPTVLRIGMAIVVIWFGAQELMHPEMWISYIPDSAVSISTMSASALVHLNGAFEIVFGIAMLIGIKTRLSALLLALHMFEITYVVGYDAVGMRDLGLAFGLLSVSMFGSSPLSFDMFQKNSEEEIPVQPEVIQPQQI